MKRTLFFWLFYLAVKGRFGYLKHDTTKYTFIFIFKRLVKCVDWGYDPDNGPSTWGGMCKSGTHQSPINIQTSSVEVDSNINEIGFTNYEIYGLLNVKNYENSGMLIRLA
jgi:carbonic anhydrase